MAKKTKAPKIKEETKALKAEIVDKIPEPQKALVTKSKDVSPALLDGLSSYIQHIQKYPLLTREQENEIAIRYKEHGNPKDAEILVTSNLRFVVKVAAEYSKFGSKLIDLIQEGNMGLMHAVREYNPYKGVKLITYAVWWIRGYIQEYLMRQYSMVRIGTTQNQRKLFYRLEKEKERLGSMGIEPSTKLLSTNLGVTEEELESMQQRLSSRDLSLDNPVGDENPSRLLDMATDGSDSADDVMVKEQSLFALEKAIEHIKPHLNEKENILLKQRILAENPKTLQEIGEEWGVTREAVRQMEARVIKKIRDTLASDEESNIDF